MGPAFFKPIHIKSMIKHKILFLSQLTSCDGTLLLKWQDLNYKPQFHNLRRIPLWYTHLENLVLQSPLTSRRLTALFALYLDQFLWSFYHYLKCHIVANVNGSLFGTMILI